MKEININIERIDDCFAVTENGVTREFVGDFSFEATGVIMAINFKGHEPNPFDGWVKCSDRLPEPETPVLILLNGVQRIGEIRWDHPSHEESYTSFRYWDDPENDGRDWDWFDVTHWRPLPAPLPAIKEQS